MMDTIQPCDKCHTVHSIYYDCENPPIPNHKIIDNYIGLLGIAVMFGFALGTLVFYWWRL